MEFVDNDYGDVPNESFNLAFKEEVKIQRRLDDLKQFNKQILINKIKRVRTIDTKMYKLYKKKLSSDNVSRDIINRTYVNDKSSVYFKFTKEDGILGRPILIMKPGKAGHIYSKNKDPTTKKAIDQFKQMVENIPESDAKIKQPTKIEKEETNLDEYVLVDTSLESNYIRGLTPNENRELEGALNPTESVLPESRIGDNGALQLQEDY